SSGLLAGSDVHGRRAVSSNQMAAVSAGSRRRPQVHQRRPRPSSRSLRPITPLGFDLAGFRDFHQGEAGSRRVRHRLPVPRLSVLEAAAAWSFWGLQGPEANGKCEGRKSPPLVQEAKRLRRRSPKGHQRSYRDVAAELAKLGYVNEQGKVFNPASIASILSR